MASNPGDLLGLTFESIRSSYPDPASGITKGVNIAQGIQNIQSQRAELQIKQQAFQASAMDKFMNYAGVASDLTKSKELRATAKQSMINLSAPAGIQGFSQEAADAFDTPEFASKFSQALSSGDLQRAYQNGDAALVAQHASELFKDPNDQMRMIGLLDQFNKTSLEQKNFNLKTGMGLVGDMASKGFLTGDQAKTAAQALQRGDRDTFSSIMAIGADNAKKKTDTMVGAAATRVVLATDKDVNSVVKDINNSADKLLAVKLRVNRMAQIAQKETWSKTEKAEVEATLNNVFNPNSQSVSSLEALHAGNYEDNFNNVLSKLKLINPGDTVDSDTRRLLVSVVGEMDGAITDQMKTTVQTKTSGLQFQHPMLQRALEAQVKKYNDAQPVFKQGPDGEYYVDKNALKTQGGMLKSSSSGKEKALEFKQKLDMLRNNDTYKAGTPEQRKAWELDLQNRMGL